MPAAAAVSKPAPLALGVRDADVGNRVEILPRKGLAPRDEVDQLLTEFAREARLPAVWQPPLVDPAPPVVVSETEQLRARVSELETRVRTLEAANQIRNDGAGRLNQRVLAVLEQLVAELRERR